ncbi:MAG TPA: hypothetical protein VI336_02685 [Candidatus Saccharimonadales bacterium]|nr:hypothetical protein [Candidatus Saccharimonadales bacterium]
MSAKKGNSLEQFKLFYEEVATSKPLQNRIRRIRASAPANS